MSFNSVDTSIDFHFVTGNRRGRNMNKSQFSLTARWQSVLTPLLSMDDFLDQVIYFSVHFDLSDVL